MVNRTIDAEPRRLDPARSPWVAVCVVAWALSLIAGLGGLVAYKGHDGSQSAPPSQRPDFFTPTSGPRPSVVVFVHPKCSCTLATLGEPKRAMARAPSPDSPKAPDFIVVAAFWSGLPDDWCHTALVDALLQFPRARLIVDRDLALIRRLHITTSGHILFYDAAGMLRFSGGVTPARGHEGPSVGGASLADLVRGGQATTMSARTYGCPMIREACDARCP